MNAIFLLGTLKPKEEFSHTDVLCQLLIENLQQFDISSEIIRLTEYTIKPGIKTQAPGGDDWPDILKKMLAADIIIFATPIWWGIQSSLIQRVVERLDELNDKLLETGTSDFQNKIGGIVITGAEDGAQHIAGNLLNFMVWNGFTMPPACSLSWLGDASKDTTETLLERFRKLPAISAGARTMASNLAFFAKLLKDNPIPTEGEGVLGDIAPGTVGMKG